MSSSQQQQFNQFQDEQFPETVANEHRNDIRSDNNNTAKRIGKGGTDDIRMKRYLNKIFEKMQESN